MMMVIKGISFNYPNSRYNINNYEILIRILLSLLNSCINLITNRCDQGFAAHPAYIIIIVSAIGFENKSIFYPIFNLTRTREAVVEGTESKCTSLSLLICWILLLVWEYFQNIQRTIELIFNALLFNFNCNIYIYCHPQTDLLRSIRTLQSIPDYIYIY